jgi:hypothetical protein
MSDKIIILTKQEIGNAITNYIGIFKEGMTFFPYYISGTDQELNTPNDVMFYLDYIPKGSKSKDVPHKI